MKIVIIMYAPSGYLNYLSVFGLLSCFSATSRLCLKLPRAVLHFLAKSKSDREA